MGRGWPEIQEALIGVAFALAATGSLLVLSGHTHGGEQLADLASCALKGPMAWTHAYAVGGIGYALGLGISVLLDLPTGPAVVWALTASALLAAGARRVVRMGDVTPE